MAEKLQFDLVTPEKLLMSQSVDMVGVPGEEGDFAVLARHAPVISTLRPGLVAVYEGGAVSRIFVRGGFAEVTPKGLTVLAEEAVPLGDIDMAALEQEIRNAGEDVADAGDDETRAQARARLARLEAMREAVRTAPAA
jgi:F-type H+-transporting ATPase subunit epsilon